MKTSKKQNTAKILKKCKNWNKIKSKINNKMPWHVIKVNVKYRRKENV